MKSERGTIWKNSIFGSFSQIIRVVTNLLIFIGIARFYNVEALGQFSLAFQVANICLIIADFGFDTLLTTSIANQQNNPVKISREYFTIKLVLAAISTLVMASIPAFQAISKESSLLIYSLILYMVFSTFNNYCYAIFRGYQKFEYETKNSFISNVALLVLLLIFGSFHVSLIYIMIFFVVSRFIGVLLGIKAVNKLIGASVLVFDISNWRNIIKEIMVFGLQYIFGNLYFLLDTVLIGVWLGDAATGVYQAGFRIMLLALIVVDVIRNPLLPVFSRLFYENRTKWIEISRLYFKMLFLLGIPILYSFFFGAEFIINIIYGPGKYSNAIPVLKIFGIVTFIRLLGDPFVLVLTTSRRQHVLMIFAIIGTFFTLILNTALLNRFGILGAAWISVAVNIIVNLLPLFFIEKGLVSVLLDKRLSYIWLFIFVSLPILILHPSNVFLLLGFVIFIPLAYYVGLDGNERKIIFSKYALKPLL